MHERMILSHRNRIDAATLSGGDWTAAQPLANLQNRFLGKTAKSSSAGTVDTIIDCDFGASTLVRVVCIVGHNLSTAAQIKVQLRTATGGGGTLVAGHSTWADVWPAMYEGSPDRKPTDEEAAGLAAELVGDVLAALELEPIEILSFDRAKFVSPIAIDFVAVDLAVRPIATVLEPYAFAENPTATDDVFDLAEKPTDVPFAPTSVACPTATPPSRPTITIIRASKLVLILTPHHLSV